MPPQIPGTLTSQTLKATGQLWRTADEQAQKDGNRGTVFFPNGERYQGEWKDNKRHGRGTLIYKNGDKYEGDWQNGVRHGLGGLWVYQQNKYKLRYNGGWDNDRPEGMGKYFDDGGNSYDGEWHEGLRHGRGRAVYGGRPIDGFGGDVFEGNWYRDVRHGLGTMTYANGDIYEGAWVQDQKHGQGTFYYMQRGRRFDGVWQNDTPTAGSYAEIQPASSGAPGSIPCVELAAPQHVLNVAQAAALSACS